MLSFGIIELVKGNPKRGSSRGTKSRDIAGVAEASDPGLRIVLSVLAKAADVPPPVISRFMADERGVTFNTAEQLAKQLGLSLQPTAKK